MLKYIYTGCMSISRIKIVFLAKQYGIYPQLSAKIRILKGTLPPIWPIFKYVNIHYQQNIYTPLYKPDKI